MTTTTIDKCTEFINKVRESRFTTIKNRKVNKFSRLAAKSNNVREFIAQPIDNSYQLQTSNSNNKWVTNLPNIPSWQPKSPYCLKAQIMS